MMVVNQKNNKITYTIPPCLKTHNHPHCFFRGQKTIEVDIKLDLGANEVDRLYQQFWKLEGLYQLHMVYKGIRRYVPSFLNLEIMKQQRMMSEKDVVNALKIGKELPHLKDQFQLLVEEINSLEYKKMVLEQL
jgi:hypothetical protein